MTENGSPVEKIETRCCIAGGGPAGMVGAFLLARSGVECMVLEKHADFLRDFRGDTIHPSTLEIMHELGLLDEFLKRPHQEVKQLRAQVGETMLTIGDFSHVPARCKFIALMPQWEFLNFIAEQGKQYRSFQLRMEAEVTGLIQENGRVAGVRAKTPNGELEIRADLTIGADGRHSTVRGNAGLETLNLGAPMDVLWMRVSRKAGDPGQVLGRVDTGRMLVMIDRGDYWQCAYVIPKGAFAEVRQKGLSSFRDDIAGLAPFLRDRVDELSDWNDIKLLTVAVDRLRKWYARGLLCIGDAAHAMSPIGGVGINLAIQDAVAAANILTVPLLTRAVSTSDLRKVQQRREFPTRVIQRVQLLVQNNVITRILGSKKKISPPRIVKLLDRWPLLQRIPARLAGVGVRPEHVRTSALTPQR